MVLGVFQSHQQRIATLYLPFVGIILENKHRLTPSETLPPPGGNSTATPATSSGVDTNTSKSSSLPRDASFKSVSPTSIHVSFLRNSLRCVILLKYRLRRRVDIEMCNDLDSHWSQQRGLG